MLSGKERKSFMCSNFWSSLQQAEGGFWQQVMPSPIQYWCIRSFNKRQNVLMSSWIPCFWPALPDRGSKPCTAHLSEIVKTSPCLAFLLCTQTGLVVRQYLCPPSQIPVLLPMLGAWAKMRLSNLENYLILEELFLFRMSFKDAAQSRTFGLFFCLVGQLKQLIFSIMQNKYRHPFMCKSHTMLLLKLLKCFILTFSDKKTDVTKMLLGWPVFFFNEESLASKRPQNVWI